MGSTEADISAEVRQVAADLRYLVSCDAERMSDYLRINNFVKVGSSAARLLEHLIKEKKS